MKRNVLSIPLLLVVGVTFAAYAKVFDRYFASEDFLLLRVLRDSPPWANLSEFFLSSWLSSSYVQFYRPVGTLLLALEGELFGNRVLWFNLTHLAVHSLNVALLYGIGRRLFPDASRGFLAVGALMFALHPFHPNAVIFIASFATMFQGTFLLASAWLFLKHVESRRLSSLIASAASFSAALGSYESAVVFAVLPCCYELLAPRGTAGRVGHLLRTGLAFGVPCLAYLGLRLALFGTFLGGYDSVSDDLTASGPWMLLTRFEPLLRALLDPVVPPRPIPGMGLLLGFLFLFLPFVAASWWIRQREDDPRPLLFSWVWILSSLAPFLTMPVIPSNGRYWYVASAGLSLFTMAVLRWLPRNGVTRVASLVIPVLIAARFGYLLQQDLEYYKECGDTTLAIQQQALELTEGIPLDQPVFIGDYPRLTMSEAQQPVAPCLMYGIHDLLNPPFTENERLVYGLSLTRGQPPIALALSNPEASVLLWNPFESRLEKATFDKPLRKLANGFPVLEIYAPEDGVTMAVEESALWFEYQVHPGTEQRLVMTGPANATILTLPDPEPGQAKARVPFPLDVTRFHLQFGKGQPVYWWVQAKDERERIVATTEMRRMQLVEPAAD